MVQDNNDEKNEIDLESIDSEVADVDTDTARYKITTYGADFTLELLSKKIDDKEIIVPPFQRRYVWPIKKASKLIESFLLGLPVPQVFLYREDETQDLLVVDGQQRLKTVNFFLKGIFDNDTVFRLTGVREEWEGKRFDDLTAADKRKLNNYILRANIFEQTEPLDKSSIFEIFERLNTGGMALTPQEIRNCVIRGGSIGDFLSELNNYEKWRKILKREVPDTRMRDIEMILRFFALYERRSTYKKPMKDFISDYMRDNRNLDSKNQKINGDLFCNVVNFVAHEIPDNAFRLKAGVNIAIFDSIMVAIAVVGPDKILDFKVKYGKLLADETYLEDIANHTTDVERVKRRIETAISYFKR